QKVRPRATGLENDVLELPGTQSTHDQALMTLPWLPLDQDRNPRNEQRSSSNGRFSAKISSPS
ncbi:hypothetical protein ABT255_59710, partial [Streptomyces mirabilis]